MDLHPVFETVTELESSADVLRRRRYGMVEVVGGRLVRIVLRPWPKLVSWPEVRLLGAWHHRFRRGDLCRLYYNQPRAFSQFLALTYVVSCRGTTFGTFRTALDTLDAIARLKGSQAVLCDASNLRISDRLLARWGWEPHAPQRWRRNFIKRFAATGQSLNRPASDVVTAALEAQIAAVQDEQLSLDA